MSTQIDIASLRYRVTQLEQGGVGGGISSVTLNVSGSAEALTGDTFYISGSNGISFTVDGAENKLVINGGAISEIPISSQAYTNISTVYTSAGGSSFDADQTPGTYFFKVSGYVDTNCTMSVQLYNLTDSMIETSVDITSNSPTSSVNNSITLTGNKFYETRFKRTNGTISNTVYLLNSGIRIS